VKKQITDRVVLQQVSEILTSGKPYKEQYEALDCLWFAVENYHPSGMAAQVLETVSAAQRHVTLKGGDPALSPTV
jgi:hypothetical protein